MGNIVYIGDDGQQKTLANGIEDAIAVKVIVVDRSDVALVLKREGFSGNDEEIDALVRGGLADEIREDANKECLYKVISGAVEEAKDRGDIEYADEARKALGKLGFETISCDCCIECMDGVCSRYAGSVSPEEATDCGHYNDDNQLVLWTGRRNGDMLEFPYRYTQNAPLENKEEIMKALKKDAELADMIQSYVDRAEQNGEKVRLTTPWMDMC